MQLVFIGSGSAFTDHAENYNSNMLLIHEKTQKKLLIDCGSDARHALGDLGYSYKDIDAVYISHLHADHAGGLEWLALSRMFDSQCGKTALYANSDILLSLWNNTLSGGLCTIEGINSDLSTFFDLHPVEENGSFMWEDIHFQTVRTIHVMAGFTLMPSYGLIFTLNNKCILITSDTQFVPHQLDKFYQEADTIFHDCETAVRPSHVHAHFDELKTLSGAVKSKMWLYHYNPSDLPDAKTNGFAGFVKRGQVFHF